VQSLSATEKVQEFEAQRRAWIRRQQEKLDRAKAERQGRKKLEAERDREQRLADLTQRAKRLGMEPKFVGRGERLDGL
jgi:hypothetical protein